MIPVIAAFLTLGVTPVAHSQIVPVNLARESAPDSKIPNAIALRPLPRVEPRKPVKDRRVLLFVTMSAGVYTASAFDMEESKSLGPDLRELDPLAKPFVRLPAPAYYAAGAIFATGINWLGWRMASSPRWRKIWWVPQATSIGGNLSGYAYTRAHS